MIYVPFDVDPERRARIQEIEDSLRAKRQEELRDEVWLCVHCGRRAHYSPNDVVDVHLDEPYYFCDETRKTHAEHPGYRRQVEDWNMLRDLWGVERASRYMSYRRARA